MIRSDVSLKAIRKIVTASGMTFRYLGNKKYAIVKAGTNQELSVRYGLGTWIDLYEQDLLQEAMK
jgi:hypothetical protein